VESGDLEDRRRKDNRKIRVRKQIVRRWMDLIRIVFSDGAMCLRRPAQPVGGG
jgi:hypothetical protein